MPCRPHYSEAFKSYIGETTHTGNIAASQNFSETSSSSAPKRQVSFILLAVFELKSSALPYTSGSHVLTLWPVFAL